MAISTDYFGTTVRGEEVTQATLTNASGAKISVLNYGCIVQSIVVPDKNGQMVNVCLGYPTLEQYESDTSYFGAVVGRYANRIGDGKFTLNGVEYKLEQNDGSNHLHGGSDGFHTRVYEMEASDNKIVLYRVSADGESGYPGNLLVTVIYTWTDDNRLGIEYKAKSDADTVVNLSNHAYFNLSGAGNGDILDHDLRISASYYTEIGPDVLPTGTVSPVEGTPFDFRTAKKIGRDIHADFPQIKHGQGYDHNFVLDGTEPSRFVAEAYSPQSGIKMQVRATKPAVQFYSGNFIRPIEGNGGAYHKHSGFCLETQYYPDSMAHENFPSPILKKDEEYHHKTEYSFGI